MTVYESDIPGVGRKFELEVDDEARLIVVIHHDGRREVFRRPKPEADSQKLFDLSSRDARQLGAILEGVYFESVDVNDLDVPLGDAIIEWVEIEDGSPAVDRTLADLEIRRQTGASVIAVQRGEETRANPGPSFTIAAGDMLVTLGTREEQAALERLLEDS